MIDYHYINKNYLIGTLKYCIKEFPEDFSNKHNLKAACELLGIKEDYQTVLHFKDNPHVNQEHLQTIAILEPSLAKQMLLKGLYNNDVKITNNNLADACRFFMHWESNSPTLRDYNLKLFIKKCLKPKGFKLDRYSMENLFRKLPNQNLKKYFLKNLQLNEMETKFIIVYLLKDFEDLNMFFRICKPKIEWKELIHSINMEKFYQITSIINTMQGYDHIKCSYIEFQKQFINKDLIPKEYSDTITKYLQDTYEQNSSFRSLMPNSNFTSSDNRITGPNGETSISSLSGASEFPILIDYASSFRPSYNRITSST